MSLTQQDHGVGGLVLHPDGTVERSPVPRAPANSEFVDGVASTDATVQVSGSHVLGARIFLPEIPVESQKSPLVLYFHGGGFVLFHADTYFYHSFCERVAKAVKAIVVSVDYRLAPEHRIPAAYEDAVLALKWLQLQASEPGQCGHKWLAADFSRCFLMGDSAGANIVHNVAGRHPSSSAVQGLALIQPFFGGIERTALELQMADDKYLPLAANDTLWRLALPEGADRDHPACNPLEAANLMRTTRLVPRILAVVGGRDPMHERQLRYVEMIKAAGGKDVKLVDYESATHAFQLFKPAQAVQLLEELERFINAGSSSSSSSSSSRL